MGRINLEGKRFNKILVVGYSHYDKNTEDTYWFCRCDCGNEKVIRGSSLRNRGTTSCGCYNVQRTKETHIKPHRINYGIEEKLCRRCKEWKSLDNFHRSGRWIDGYSYICKQCKSLTDKQYRQIKSKQIIKRQNEWNKIKKRNDVGYRIKCSIQNRIYYALKGNLKSSKTLDLLGCSIEDFKVYLRSKFNENMTWDNYGSYWHLDHIIPCIAFDLSDPNAQKKCFHYTNLQPLEAIKNREKSDLLYNGVHARTILKEGLSGYNH